MRSRADYVLAGAISIVAYESYVAAKNLRALFGDDDEGPPGASIGEILMPANASEAVNAAAFGLVTLMLFTAFIALRRRQQAA